MRLRRPDAAEIARYLDEQRALPFTYGAVGATRELARPAGFAIDHNTQRLAGSFAAARRALAAWAMFPRWVEVTRAPIAAGEVVAILLRTGVWWLSAARIVYVIDEPARFGFAYGTLPGHAECGEERFLVEQRGDGVYYDLYAFSCPRHWAARLGGPVTRALQHRFARDSLAAMLASSR